MDILTKIQEFVKVQLNTITLIVLIMLLVLFSFACGYIIAKYQNIKPIQIQQP